MCRVLEPKRLLERISKSVEFLECDITSSLDIFSRVHTPSLESIGAKKLVVDLLQNHTV